MKEEKESKIFKKWLQDHLTYGEVTVVFTKKDGSERVMRCTTNASLIPDQPIIEGTETKKERKKNEDICPVFDIEAKSWKCFRWDSIKDVRFTIGEENAT